MSYSKPVQILGILLSVFFVIGSAYAAPEIKSARDSKNVKKIVSSVVDYDQVSDQLTVEVKDIGLRQVMAVVARKSGIRVMMDPEVNHNITVNFKNQKLIKGLKRLLRDTSSAYFFNEKKDGKGHLLLAIKILPTGKQASSNLRPLVGLPNEAIQYAREKQGVSNHATKRWQARRDRMPKKLRAKLDKMAEERLARGKKQKEMADKRKEARKAKKEERRQKRKARQAAINKELQTNHPDLYEERKRLREEARANAKSQQDERGIFTFGR